MQLILSVDVYPPSNNAKLLLPKQAKKGSPVLPVRQPSSRGERQRRPDVAADVTMELLEAGGYLDMPLMVRPCHFHARWRQTLHSLH